MRSLQIEFPYPPSLNVYRIPSGNRIRISDKGKAYHSEVYWKWKQSRNKKFSSGSRLSIKIYAYPPDRRKRDLDNIVKIIFDSMQKAEIFNDDNQIDYFSVTREEVVKSGKVELEIQEI